MVSNRSRSFHQIHRCLRLLPLALMMVAPGSRIRAAQPPDAPLQVFSADPQTLADSKAALEHGNSDLQAALNVLLKDANALLNQKPPSVMQKKRVPPSGDKHDYLSQAPYYWRDTNSPDQKYLRRDGERNPEANADSDAGRLGRVCSSVHTLALAWYFSGDEQYAAKAADFVRVFFLDPATRMRPNLDYAQGIPGQVTGRPAGLIGARGLADLVDGLGLLAGARSWPADDRQKMTAWAADYFHWLTTSKIGLGEDAAANNHGTFYDVQAVSLALFLGDTNFAREKLLAARERRIAREIEPDGRMPRELTRTLSFHYSLFNLVAEMDLADLGRAAGVDLWRYQTADGRGLRQAVEFIAPYADPQRRWPYPQIRPVSRAELGDVLRRADAEFPDSQPIMAALKFLPPPGANPARLYLKFAPDSK